MNVVPKAVIIGIGGFFLGDAQEDGAGEVIPKLLGRVSAGLFVVELDWVEVEGKGKIYSWERAWHPVHPALRALEGEPYITVLVELPAAGNIRMIGNLLGDRRQDVVIGSNVEVVFDHHTDNDPPYSLAHWKVV